MTFLSDPWNAFAVGWGAGTIMVYIAMARAFSKHKCLS